MNNDTIQMGESTWNEAGFLKQKNATLNVLNESYENLKFQIESLIEAMDAILKDKDDEIEKLNEYFDEKMKTRELV